MDANLVKSRWLSWQAALDVRDEHTIVERYRLHGLTAENLGKVLGSRLPRPPRTLKSLQFSESKQFTAHEGQITPVFADLLSPIAIRAVRSFRRSLPRHVAIKVTEEAWRDFTFHLLQELTHIAHHALFTEFNIFRSAYSGLSSVSWSRCLNSGSDQLYRMFRQTLIDDRGEAFYSRYPVVQKLFQLCITQWRSHVRRLLTDFVADKQEIASMQGVERLPAIQRVEMGLSDRHKRGRTVTIISLCDGKRIVYKPRSLLLEERFMQVLAFLNEKLCSEGFQVMKVLDHGDHGWCEFVDAAQVTCAEQAKQFYFRTGMLLAALYALGATDCHFENIVAWKGFPVMIDLETLFHPDNNLIYSSADVRGPGAGLYRSVTRIGLLPNVRSEDAALDLSPLSLAGIAPDQLALTYLNAGMDDMSLREVLAPMTIPPLVSSTLNISPTAVLDGIQSGFRTGYTLIEKHRHELLTRAELLPSMQNAECRFVARNTQLYGWLSQRALESRALQSGIERSIEFERLFRPALGDRNPAAWLAVAEAERKALERMDIPLFTAKIAGRHLLADGRIVVRNCLERAPWDLVRERIESMCEEDLNGQLAIIEMLLAQQNEAPVKPTPVGLRSERVGRGRVMAAADAIAEAVWRHKIGNQAGLPSWLTLHPLVGSPGQFRTLPGGPGLYQGSAGIGLFLAAHHKVSGNEESRRRSYMALRSATDEQMLGMLRSARKYDFGDGLAGIAYGLFRAGALLGDLSLKQQAQDILLSIDDRHIVDVTSPCVLSGLAGLILVSDIVAQEASKTGLRAKMKIASELLLEREIRLNPAVSGWRIPNGDILAGFAHGSAGIAYALRRAADHLADARIREAGLRGEQHASESYDVEAGNWWDTRNQLSGVVAACSWCHGAIGVGIGLLGSGAHHTPATLQTFGRVEQVLTEDLAKGPPTHSLCCGVAGALDLVGNDSPFTLGESIRGGIVDYLCDPSGHHCVAGNYSRVFMPGLFTGSSGIGYQLLRSEFPDLLPSLLLVM